MILMHYSFWLQLLGGAVGVEEAITVLLAGAVASIMMLRWHQCDGEKEKVLVKFYQRRN